MGLDLVIVLGAWFAVGWHWEVPRAIGLSAETSPVEKATIDGIDWDVYANTAPGEKKGLFQYALITEAGPSTIVLVGDAAPEVFDSLATALAAGVHSAERDNS